MKRILALLLSLIMVLSLVACGGKEANEPVADVTESKVEAAPITEAPEVVPATDDTTEAPTEDSAEDSADGLPFKTGIVFGDGVVTLDQLKEFKNWIKGLSPKPNHDEMVAQMGVNPYPSNLDMWKEGEQAVYYWTDGKDFVTVTLKPTDDGSGWTYKAISWTSGVNG